MGPTLQFKTKLLCLLMLTTAWYTALLGQVKPGVEADISHCWSHEIESGMTLAADSRQIYVGSAEGRIEAVATNGKKIWESDFGGTISSRLLALDSSLLVITSKVSSTNSEPLAGTLRSLSKETGIANWSVNVPGSERHYLAATSASVILVTNDGQIVFVDVNSGKIQGQRQLGIRLIAEPFFTDSHIFIADEGNRLITIPISVGGTTGQRNTAFRTTAITENRQKQLVIGDERGNVSLLGDRNGRPVWQFRSGGEISRLFAIGDNILAVSHDNFVYLLSGSNGGIVWKKRVGGRVSSIARIGDRYLMLASIDDENAVLIDLSNGKTASQIPFNKDERPIDDPLTSDGKIYVLTNAALRSYSLNGCSLENQKAAPGSVNGLL